MFPGGMILRSRAGRFREGRESTGWEVFMDRAGIHEGKVSKKAGIQEREVSMGGREKYP